MPFPLAFLHLQAAINRRPFKYVFFKIVREAIHFLVKLQALVLKHFQKQTTSHVFFEFFS